MTLAEHLIIHLRSSLDKRINLVIGAVSAVPITIYKEKLEMNDNIEVVKGDEIR